MKWRPELLSPAGNWDKMQLAALYGADAVYFSGQQYGLRFAADNFSDAEIIRGMEWLHQRGKKGYITVNSFFRNPDFKELDAYIDLLVQAQVDAVIVSDLAVVSAFQKRSEIPVHLSTQTSCLNLEATKFWRDQGIKRIVLGRELSLKEIEEIKNRVEIELEVFVHGAMCMSYAGNCLISNYHSQRDSNRGGCAHNCRFDYRYQNTPFYLGSKDLCGLDYLAELQQLGIDALKIEGRMKGPGYVGQITKRYATALRAMEHRATSAFSFPESCAGYLGGENSDLLLRSLQRRESRGMIGMVLEVGEEIVIQVRAPFAAEDQLQLVPFVGEHIPVKMDKMTDLLDRAISDVHPGSLVKIPLIPGIEAMNLVIQKDDRCE